MERDARYASFFQNHQFQHRSPRMPKKRKSGCAGILRELRSCDDGRSSRNPESIRRTNGRTRKESGACDWIRSARSFSWSNKPCVTKASSSLSSWRKETEFLRSQMHSEMQRKTVSFRLDLHEREVQQEHISQSFQNMEHHEAPILN